MSAKDDLSIPLVPGRYYHIFNRGINRCDLYFNQENYKYFLKKYGEKLAGYFDTFGYCLLNNHFHIMIRVRSMDDIYMQAVIDFEVVNKSFYKDYVFPWISRLGFSMSTLGDALGLSCDAAEEDLTNFKNLLNLSETYGDTIIDNPDFPQNLQDLDFKSQLASWIVSERFRGFLLGYAKAINKQEARTGSLFQKGFRRKYITDDEHNKREVLFYIHHNPIHHFFTGQYDNYQWSSYNTYLSNTASRLCRSEGLNWFDGKEGFHNFGVAYRDKKRSDFDWMIDDE